MSGVEILFNDNRGVYIPQNFVEEMDLSKWYGVPDWTLGVLEAGPDHEDYWEAWDQMERDAYFVDADNNTWTLYQDGDLFLVCEEIMSIEERINMGFIDIEPNEALEEHVDYLESIMPDDIAELYAMANHDLVDGSYADYSNTIAKHFTDATAILGEWLRDNYDSYFDFKDVAKLLFGNLGDYVDQFT